MTYTEWVQNHGKKHQAIMSRLAHLDDQEVIEYFRFENMLIHEPDFCPLYAQNKKCHNIETLNCYLCACPYFVFDDTGLSKENDKTIYSKCNINSKDGARFESENSIHQDCSGCLIPHDEQYAERVFSRDWARMMGYGKLK